MAGLMDASIIRPELSNALAAGYQQAEQSRQLLAQQRQQTEINQTKLEQLKQDRMMLNQLQDQLRAAGKDPDPNKIFDAFIASGNPDYVLKGMEYRQRYKELQRAEAILRKEFPDMYPQTGAPSVGGAPAVAPGAPAAAPGEPMLDIRSRSEGTVPPVPAPGVVPTGLPTSAPIPQVGGPIATPNVTAAPLAPVAAGGVGTFGTQVGPPNPQADMTPEDRAFSKLASDWVMGGMQGPQPTRADAAAIVNTGRAPVNALAPVAAPVNALATSGAAPAAGQPATAPVNALAAPAAQTPQDRAAELRRKIQLYSSVNDPNVKAMVRGFENELKELTKLYVVPGVGLVSPASKETIVPTQSEFERTLKGLNLPPDQERALRLQWAQKQATHAPGTTVNVSTEKSYGSRFGGLLAERDAAKLDTAEKATDLADSANRIIGLVQQGNVFTGPAADIKLNIARVLNVAGANNQEKIANTESLIAATGQSTLNAIKGAGLGTGQGFTDKDLRFLQGVAGGTIGLTQQTLTELARLQHQTAVKSAERWNKRVKELSPEVIKGASLSTEPIVVPPLAFPNIKKQPSVVQTPAPAGLDPALWSVMTPQERALWQK